MRKNWANKGYEVSIQNLTCQTSLEASLVSSYHLAKKALEKDLQYLQMIPLKKSLYRSHSITDLNVQSL